jgi:hypothetical protein
MAAGIRFGAARGITDMEAATAIMRRGITPIITMAILGTVITAPMAGGMGTRAPTILPVTMGAAVTMAGIRIITRAPPSFSE